MYHNTHRIIYYLYQQIHTYIINYITNASTCFGASLPSSGSFDVEDGAEAPKHVGAFVIQFIIYLYAFVGTNAKQ